MINNPQIGADPEVFLYDVEESLYVPAIGLVGGTKANPKPVSDNGHFVQEDNVMAEFNIPPATTAEQFVSDLQFVMREIERIVPECLQISVVPTAMFEDHFLTSPEACISGCDPYSNAWKDGEIEEAVDYKKTNFRHAGAHLHFGYDNPNEETSMNLIKANDLYLGIPSVLLDDDTKRRQSYGKAGAYREKPYGVEYRSLSNFWLRTPRLMEWVFNNAMLAIDYINLGMTPPSDVETVINTSDKSRAEYLIEEYEIPMP